MNSMAGSTGSEWKDTLKLKLKATSQEDKLLKWKEHFKNLLGNLPEITNKPTQKIILVIMIFGDKKQNTMCCCFFFFIADLMVLILKMTLDFHG